LGRFHRVQQTSDYGQMKGGRRDLGGLGEGHFLEANCEGDLGAGMELADLDKNVKKNVSAALGGVGKQRKMTP